MPVTTSSWFRVRQPGPPYSGRYGRCPDLRPFLQPDDFRSGRIEESFISECPDSMRRVSKPGRRHGGRRARWPQGMNALRVVRPAGRGALKKAPDTGETPGALQGSIPPLDSVVFIFSVTINPGTTTILIIFRPRTMTARRSPVFYIEVRMETNLPWLPTIIVLFLFRNLFQNAQ